ncbi:hypothetical protein AWW67_15100 [Roseivirga seohaensis]|uniref:Uncharacterized protein n=2 Tax=Roseivirga seohaensis TaxID=1914963 RepID=A0A150Y3F2_9BACT|nr:hypothetical protein AWW67_15100 [Roseivirga seohaensis]
MIMKNRFLIMGMGLLLASSFAFRYVPDYYSKCLTNAKDMNGNDVPNDYYCNITTEQYNGESTDLAVCEWESGDFAYSRCSGNSLYFFPEMYN